MTLTPDTGNNFTLPSFTTSQACPSSATHTYVQIFGQQLPDEGQVIRDVSRQGTGTSGGFTLEATRRFQDVFDAAKVPITAGAYRAELVCTDATLAKLARFTDDFRFTSSTAYTTAAEPPPSEPPPSDPPPTTVPPGTVRPITNACPAGTPQAPFSDVRPNTHEQSIDCIVYWRITSGQTATTYGVAGNVTRGQMARFIANLIRESGGNLPAGPDRFADDNGNQFEGDINALVAAGVVSGQADGRYNAVGPVFRDQMATFLVNAYQYRTGKTLGASRDYFTDDTGNTHEPRINRAAEAGFTGGTGGTNYSPRGLVRRDSMASFLARELDKLVAEDGARRRS